MKILLIQPNSSDEVNKEFVSLQFPINLGYIAAVLIEAKHEVKLIDLNVMEKSVFTNALNLFKPDIVGFTALTPNIYNASKLISEVKKNNPNIKIVLGGIHASALPIQTMEEIKDLDFLVFGEGEKTILELVSAIQKKQNFKNIRGLVYKNKNKIIKNKLREMLENLDTIPMPPRKLISIELYNTHHVSRGFSRKELKILEIMTSRGCPNNCIFCAGHLNYGMKIRFRSFENIVKEIDYNIREYGITHISIEDDTFTINKELVRKVCGYFKKMKLTWNCNTRVNTVDYPLLKLMAESGCKKVAFGVESGNPEMLKKIKKNITVEQVINATRYAKKAGIRYVECDFILGSHPDETVNDIEDTIKLIYKIMPDFLMLSIMCPYPGTEIYTMMLERGYIKKINNWSQFSYFGKLDRYERLTYLTSKQMVEIQKKVLKEYYGSIKYIFSQLKQIRTINEIKYFTKMGFLFLKEFIFKTTAE